MNRKNLGILLGITAIIFTAAGSSTVMAEDLTPGVTVTASEDSPTGYTATFVYENADAKEVSVVGTFDFYKEGGEIGVVPEEATAPYEWEPGMFPAGFGNGAHEEEMKKEEGTDYWTLSMPLPSGRYLYLYNVDGAETNIEDPANPTMTADVENGNSCGISAFNVPFDSEKQEGSADWTPMMPKEGTPAGEVAFTNYTDLVGTPRPLGVYLPPEYDAEREEGYKVLYLCHGGGGNETEWFYCGNTNYLFDNLIADGKVEPTIVVTMYNGAYNWNYSVINENLIENIIPYMEENYNVGTTSSDRAFAGLSMGAMTTSNVYYSYADYFDYFGIFSGSDLSVDLDTLDLQKLKTPKIMLGAGIYDAAYKNESYGTDTDRTTLGLKEKMDELGIEYTFHEVNGGHDWTTWPQLLKLFAEECLWK